MITISNLKKQFGETIACDIPSLTINDGDILGLVGNNGAGKTTLFRMMLDLLKPDAGEVLLDGINPAAEEGWKATTGAYIDEGFLIDFLTPEEYFAFIGKITNMTQEAVDTRLKDFEKLADQFSTQFEEYKDQFDETLDSMEKESGIEGAEIQIIVQNGDGEEIYSETFTKD